MAEQMIVPPDIVPTGLPSSVISLVSDDLHVLPTVSVTVTVYFPSLAVEKLVVFDVPSNEPSPVVFHSNTASSIFGRPSATFSSICVPQLLMSDVMVVCGVV